jgi:Mg-chelatase subunit ChlD
MTDHEIETRKTTLADKLKARVAQAKATPLEESCVILIDVSGSMGNLMEGMTKLQAVKDAVPNLQARGSYVEYSLVTFSDGTETVQPPTTNFMLIQAYSDRLHTQGGTHIACGLDKGVEILSASSSPKRRIILLSDGQDSGYSGNTEREHSILQCIEHHIVVDTIAFGEDADRNLLRSISNRTGGKFFEANSPLALRDAYQKLNYQVRYLENKTINLDK